MSKDDTLRSPDPLLTPTGLRREDQEGHKTREKESYGRDGCHVEMLQAEPEVWENILTCWRGTVGRLAIFADVWGKATISPLYKKGDQTDPANYRPVSVLSHVRKSTDATILTYVCESFIQSRSHFSFQSGISIQQVTLQSQANADHGLHHVAVLDLAKTY